MSFTKITTPFGIFNDTDGTPLENGYIYIGEINKNPETFPVSIFWDDELSIPASQPIRTIAGYPSNNGSPGNIFTIKNYSITVRDKNGSLVYSNINPPAISPQIDYIGNYADLASAVSSIGSTPTTLMVNTSTTIEDGATVTTPSTLTLWFSDGGMIQGTTGGGTETLVVNGPILSDDISQIFGTNLTVTLGSAVKYSNPRWWGAKGDNSTDDIAAFNLATTAADNTKTMYIPAGLYVFGSSWTISDKTGLTIYGDYLNTNIVNKAAASNPTIVLDDSQYIKLKDLAITGRAGYPNVAISLTTTGGQTSSINKIENVMLQPNGNGIVTYKINTVTLEKVDFWPSGGPSLGATVDDDTRVHAITNDGSAGDYFNDYHIIGCNLVGIDADVAGRSLISLKDPDSTSQSVTIERCELEGLHTAIDVENLRNLRIKDCFLENADIIINATRYSVIKSIYSVSDITITNSVNVVMYDSVQTGTFDADNTNILVGAVNSEIQTYSNSSSEAVTFGVTQAGVNQADNIGIAGIKERDRVVAIGVWTTPAYDAANFSASVGTWTVDAGDVTNYQYILIGKTMFVNFYIATSSVSATPTYLSIKIPGGYTAANKTIGFTNVNDNGAGWAVSNCEITGAGQTVIRCFAVPAGASAWATSTNSTYVTGLISFEIQ